MSGNKAVLRHNGFTFKHFFVAHDRCAMKVGTDSILLGAWAPIAEVDCVLDVGTGSGLLALMLAQRTADNVTIDAVELDSQAAMQATENFAQSPWAGRITLHQADIGPWCQTQSHRYGLIICNPPYYQPGVDCASPQRATARYTTTLGHPRLLACAAALIQPQGFFSLVLPSVEGEAFIREALAQGWYLRYRTDVCETEMRPPHRLLLAFSRQSGEYFAERMVIRGSDGQYSEAFCSLTRDFYLKAR